MRPGRFLITGGYKSGSVMVQAARDGDVWQIRELFRSKDCGTQACTPVFYKDHLYTHGNDFLEENATAGNGLMCMDLAGKVRWKTSNDNIEENGSLLIADGKIFSLLSEKGVLHLLRASPDGHQELASARVCQGGNTWAPMAISDGNPLVRSRRTLVRLDVSAEAKPAGR